MAPPSRQPRALQDLQAEPMASNAAGAVGEQIAYWPPLAVSDYAEWDGHPGTRFPRFPAMRRICSA